jgi:AAA domain
VRCWLSSTRPPAGLPQPGRAPPADRAVLQGQPGGGAHPGWDRDEPARAEESQTVRVTHAPNGDQIRSSPVDDVLGETTRVPRRLDHVLWIGGGSGAGKSTVAQRLATQYGLQVYATDDAMSRHAAALTAEQAPHLARFRSMSMDERWLDRTPELMLDTFHWFQGEGFNLIVEDLLRLPHDPPVVAEGFRLLPHLVAPLLADVRRAVWLLPTPAFRRAAIESRGTTWDIASRTSDPARALEHLLTRDQLFTARIAVEARQLGLRVVDVDIDMAQDALVTHVSGLLHLRSHNQRSPT